MIETALLFIAWLFAHLWPVLAVCLAVVIVFAIVWHIIDQRFDLDLGRNI